DRLLERAAQVLGVLTKELGGAVGPSLDDALLERLELLQVSSERLLLVLSLKSGVVRTIFVEVPSHMAPAAVRHVAVVLNERLGGLTLREIRGTLSDRLRDATSDSGAHELLNIFIQEADELFDVPASGAAAAGVVLGSAQLLAGQPEFATQERLQGLLEVTERRDLLRQALAQRLLRAAGRGAGRGRGGDQEGVPRPGYEASSRPRRCRGEDGGRREVQADHGGVRSAA